MREASKLQNSKLILCSAVHREGRESSCLQKPYCISLLRQNTQREGERERKRGEKLG